jgi:hypothetical protein
VGTRASNLQEYTQLMAKFSAYRRLPSNEDLPTSYSMQLPNMVMWVSQQLKSLHRRISGQNWRQESFPFEVTVKPMGVAIIVDQNLSLPPPGSRASLSGLVET